MTDFIYMLDEKEQLFVAYWEANRDKEAKIGYQILRGLPVGMLFTIPIFIILFTGRFWYKRADMVANTELSPLLMIIIGVIIAVFVAIVHQRHKWDMKNQQYKELKAKSKK